MEERRRRRERIRGVETDAACVSECLQPVHRPSILVSGMVSSVQPRKKRANVLLYSSPVCCNTFEYVSMVWYYKERVLAVLISHHIIDVIDRHSSHRME